MVYLLAAVYMLYFLVQAVGQGCVDGICGQTIVATYFHDFVYHGAIAASAFSTIPFRMPIFAGAQMQGYHYLYDLFLSILLLFRIPLISAYWYITPVVYFISVCYVLKSFSSRLHKSELFVALIVFFFFFSGTSSYVATLIFRHSLFGYGVSSLLHTSTMFLYPTVGFSIIPLFLIWSKLFGGKFSPRSVLYIGFLLFVSFGVKFYAGTTLLVVMITYEIAYCIKSGIGSSFRATVGRLTIYGLFCLAALIVFYRFPGAMQKEPVFGWAPFATVHQIIEDDYAYPMKNMAMARETLYRMGKFSPRLIAIESFSFLLFLFHNFGTRIIGLCYLIWLIVRRKGSIADGAIAAGVVFSLSMGVLFVQRGAHWWNTLQFHYYTAVFLTVYTARWIFEIMDFHVILRRSRRIQRLKVMAFLIILLLTIPNAIEKMIEFRKTAKTVISSDELTALSQLRKQPDGVVFTVPTMPETAYIAAFTGKQLYISDEQMLQNNGIAYEDRKELLQAPENIDFNSIDPDYIYLVKKDPQFELFNGLAEGTSYVVKFENDAVRILFRKP